MYRLMLAVSGALLMGSTGAFLLLVSPVSIATVALILVGLLLMFGFGFQAGAQVVRIPHPLAQVQSIRGLQNREDPRNEPGSEHKEVA